MVIVVHRLDMIVTVVDIMFQSFLNDVLLFDDFRALQDLLIIDPGLFGLIEAAEGFKAVGAHADREIVHFRDLQWTIMSIKNILSFDIDPLAIYSQITKRKQT